MPIGSLCNRNVVFATRDTTIAEASDLMRHQHVGDLVVIDTVDGERLPVGIVTDRDIVVEVVAMGLDPKVITLGDILVGNLLTADELDERDDTLRLMCLKGIRRMPVVNVAGSLVGIVTVDDLIGELALELTEISKLTLKEQRREMQSRR
ncbi:MAG: CBS domain-containing protein [Burkholderiales bacterium]